MASALKKKLFQAHSFTLRNLNSSLHKELLGQKEMFNGPVIFVAFLLTSTFLKIDLLGMVILSKK